MRRAYLLAMLLVTPLAHAGPRETVTAQCTPNAPPVALGAPTCPDKWLDVRVGACPVVVDQNDVANSAYNRLNLESGFRGWIAVVPGTTATVACGSDEACATGATISYKRGCSLFANVPETALEPDPTPDAPDPEPAEDIE